MDLILQLCFFMLPCLISAMILYLYHSYNHHMENKRCNDEIKKIGDLYHQTV
uniref:Uncharacterized protein n=1 Tax=viral metagenome TaxID=1070528 RepID=A0A6C0BQ70_9ZZZZ